MDLGPRRYLLASVSPAHQLPSSQCPRVLAAEAGRECRTPSLNAEVGSPQLQAGAQ